MSSGFYICKIDNYMGHRMPLKVSKMKNQLLLESLKFVLRMIMSLLILQCFPQRYI